MGVAKYRALSRELEKFFELHNIHLESKDIMFSNRIIRANLLEDQILREVTLTFTENITDPKEIREIIDKTPIQRKS